VITAENPAGSPGIKDLPESERPRERIWASGVSVLSNVELLAVLLGTGNAKTRETALDLARRLLVLTRRNGDEGMTLRGLAATGPQELCAVAGVGQAKAAKILAAVELGRRMAGERPDRLSIRSPADAGRLLMEEMRYLDREHFKIVMLNTKNQVLGIELIFVGSLNTSVVHPREIFKACIRRSAAAVILAHNHPSGDPTPSPDDVEVTNRLVSAGRLLGIDVLDHLIIGERKYISLREQGMGWD